MTGGGVVGVLLPDKKAHKHVTDSLIEAARRQGITVKRLEEGQPLDQAGHLDALVHKIRTPGKAAGGPQAECPAGWGALHARPGTGLGRRPAARSHDACSPPAWRRVGTGARTVQTGAPRPPLA